MRRGLADRINHYRFRAVWRVSAGPGDVYRFLHDFDAWPAWWKEIREHRRLDEDRAAVTIRAALPYDLHLLLTRRVDDPSTHVLEAAIAGDLEGFARFSLRPEDGGTALLYEQEVIARKRLMRWLAPLARPLFAWNHARMMRSGERGLRAHLSA